ncbi:hypothetical protein HI914_02942 [Erysiphe necator]|nr:hypothetical protein HI914_02942 [Erysiphe necator]
MFFVALRASIDIYELFATGGCNTPFALSIGEVLDDMHSDYVRNQKNELSYEKKERLRMK